jgi:hypothetical protein
MATAIAVAIAKAANTNASAGASEGDESLALVCGHMEQLGDQQDHLPGRATLTGLDLLQCTGRAPQPVGKRFLIDTCLTPALPQPAAEMNTNRATHRRCTPPPGYLAIRPSFG